MTRDKSGREAEAMALAMVKLPRTRLNLQDAQGQAALLLSVEMRSLPLVEALAAQPGADPDVKDKEGLCAVHAALDLGELS